MKKIIFSVMLVASLGACKSNRSELQKENAVMLQDTSSLYNNSTLTDKAKEQPTGTSAGTALQSEPAKTTKTSSPASTSAKPVSSGSGQVAAAPVQAKKKGWSHRARGAAVGAGAGAVTGAIVNKNNRGVGALIGAVAGAASGYIIGNEVDKKKAKETK